MGGLGRARVFVDADILYSKTLRDWLGVMYTCAVSPYPPYDVLWSEDVLAEAISALRNDHPGWSGGQLAVIREHIEAAFAVGRLRDYDVSGSGFRGKDPGDAHVHAAALAGNADYLLTRNVKDLVPPDDVDDLPYEVIHPDDFFSLVAESSPEHIDAALDQFCQHYHGVDLDFDDRLRAAGCPHFAAIVRGALQAKAHRP